MAELRRNKPIPSRRLALLSLVATLAFAAACVPPSTFPDGTVPQSPPVGINGMTSEPGAVGGEVWLADLFGSQLIRFDVDTGAIAERYGPGEGLCGTDDLVVLPDGDLVATCPSTGEVIRVERGGSATVLAFVGRGVNPIELDPTGDSVLVGFGSGTRDELLRIPIEGGPIEIVADDLPLLNGFAFGPDGLLYVPTGGAEGILGSGGVGKIDPTTGTFEQIELTFGGPNKSGFNFACGLDVTDEAMIVVAQCIDPAVFAVDAETGVVSLIGSSPMQFADNLTIDPGGNVLLSSFFGSSVTVFSPQLDGSWTRSVTNVGS